MQAGELWWAGKTEAFEHKLDKISPPCFDISEPLLSAMVKDSGSREGFAWKASVIEKLDGVSALHVMWRIGMEISIVSSEAAERAQADIAKLRSTLDGFRSAIKNDMTSMKAASDRVQTEVQQMRDRYKQAQDMLTTPDFMKAIENAERMATALQAIQKLTETKISVAVFSGGAGEKA